VRAQRAAAFDTIETIRRNVMADLKRRADDGDARAATLLASFEATAERPDGRPTEKGHDAGPTDDDTHG
jgi:hypothetical protein